MSGIGIEVSAEGAEQLAAGLSLLLGRVRDPRPALEEMGAAVLFTTRRRIEKETDPDGRAWPALKSRAGAALRLSNRLYSSYTYLVERHGVRVGSNMIYAALHHFGGIIVPKNAAALVFQMHGQTIFAKKVTIPARPALGINDDDAEELGEIITDYLSEGMPS